MNPKPHSLMNFPEFIEAVTATAHRVEYGLLKLTRAITPPDVAPAVDLTGEHVGSLTEAVMGMTAGLCRIADALDGIADAIREGRSDV